MEKMQFEVTYGNDNSENYHVSICTNIEISEDDRASLLLTTRSAVEAMLIGIHFAQLKTSDSLLSVKYLKWWGKQIRFVLQYKCEQNARDAIGCFMDYYKQIYDQTLEDDYDDVILFDNTTI